MHLQVFAAKLIIALSQWIGLMAVAYLAGWL